MAGGFVGGENEAGPEHNVSWTTELCAAALRA